MAGPSYVGTRKWLLSRCLWSTVNYRVQCQPSKPSTGYPTDTTIRHWVKISELIFHLWEMLTLQPLLNKSGGKLHTTLTDQPPPCPTTTCFVFFCSCRVMQEITLLLHYQERLKCYDFSAPKTNSTCLFLWEEMGVQALTVHTSTLQVLM